MNWEPPGELDKKPCLQRRRRNPPRHHQTDDASQSPRLSLGHSGVQVITVQRILDFFNNDVMPIVYDRGSLGASGDLAPLANLFLPLIGVGDVYYEGKSAKPSAYSTSLAGNRSN